MVRKEEDGRRRGLATGPDVEWIPLGFLRRNSSGGDGSFTSGVSFTVGAVGQAIHWWVIRRGIMKLRLVPLFTR